MNRVHLLDVNVLVALFDPDHVHHEIAHDWFADSGRAAWATCPVTENGFLRVLANPAYDSPIARVTELVGRLRKFRGSGGHTFWGDEVSLADETLFDPAMMAGYRQLTDVYLLGLAIRKGGSLATFDRTIPVKAVRGATSAALHVLAPAASL